MPKGPRGQKRPADVIGNAVRVMQIATGQAADTPTIPVTPKAQAGKAGGLKGGKARAKALSSAKRSEIAKKGAAKRWGNEKKT